MKRLILLFSLVLLSYTTVAQSKIGTIDAEYILSQMPEITQVEEGMKVYSSDLRTGMDSTVTKYESLIKNYQETGSTLTEEAKKAQEADIVALENEIKGFRQKASVLIQMKRNELSGPLYEKIDAAMMEVIQEEGFTQIFHAGGNALAFSAPGSDITEKVLLKMGIEIVQQ